MSSFPPFLRLLTGAFATVVPSGTTLVLAAAQTSDYPPHAVRALSGVTIQGLPPVTRRIHVDQFGYLPGLAKVAVISDPQQGYNAFASYTPGRTLEVRRRSDGRVVFSGAPRLWRDGAVDPDSGDRGWWFDFTPVGETGDYYVFDPSTGLRSPVFRVAPDVYREVVRAALRTYYYQRLAVPLEPPYAEEPWTDRPDFPQDAQARYVNRKDDASTERDLSGGWMDADDSNKYPSFQHDVTHPLLYAYTHNPGIFGEDLSITESGNGSPDLLDELKLNLDWLVKMQDVDGGVFIKMGAIDYRGVWPISDGRRPRYYGPKCSASTLWTAATFAHAARVYRRFEPWREFADDLRARALRAWAWYRAHPRSDNCDTREIKSGSANRSFDQQDRMEAFTAIHLWLLTGRPEFHDVIRRQAPITRQLSEGLWSTYELGPGEALLEYASHPQADPALRDRVHAQLRRSAASPQWAPPPEASLYRSWITPGSYHWGRCTQFANFGTAALLALSVPDTPAPERARLRQRAADLLHAWHGVNPQGIVYLSNMGRYGAESSVRHIWHDRFHYRSPLAAHPPPGYVVGGPNQNYLRGQRTGDPQFDWIVGQPRAKAFADFNLGGPGNAWEITENAIYYQALYVRLLSAFLPAPAAAP